MSLNLRQELLDSPACSLRGWAGLQTKLWHGFLGRVEQQGCTRARVELFTNATGARQKGGKSHRLRLQICTLGKTGMGWVKGRQVSSTDNLGKS